MSIEPSFDLQMDWMETPEAHVIKADLPGLKKEEVRVEVEDGNILQIRGERKKEEEEEKDAKWRRIERSRGKFLRRFRLPQNAQMDDQVKATMKNGVLTVVIPKEVKSRGKFLRRAQMDDQVKMENGVRTVVIPKEVRKPKVKRIQISG